MEDLLVNKLKPVGVVSTMDFSDLRFSTKDFSDLNLLRAKVRKFILEKFVKRLVQSTWKATEDIRVWKRVRLELGNLIERVTSFTAISSPA